MRSRLEQSSMHVKDSQCVIRSLEAIFVEGQRGRSHSRFRPPEVPSLMLISEWKGAI